MLGESPLWSPKENCLYWVDIVGSRINRFHPESGAHDIWPTPELPTSIGLTRKDDFVVGLRQRVVRWRPGGPFETFAVPEPDLMSNRLNEGMVAPDGSFWVGTMQDNIDADLKRRKITAPTGALYRVAPDGGVSRLTEDIFGITNTMVWLDDGRFVTADTLANALYLYDYDRASDRLQRRRRLLASIKHGLPDGSTRDNMGAIYNARVGGGALAQLDPATNAVRLIDLPCNAPTSCAFGGPDLDTLYVTSSRFGGQPNGHLDGGLFALTGLGKGVAANRFG